ncbi:tumor necrosis factor receptor superfamily member 9 [Psammomys obesus]|uniref:tumor necrosis factor receptor superfamily member 9 n=1 Tax=Psammomys obesus TaxID=48139 RepID=UPI002452A19C|nr:tumor necrosis factor receptor superfamily member 9 [Psammomys obesus]
MGNNRYKLVVTVLLVLGTGRTTALQNACDECEAGTFCRNHNPVCTSCPPRTYSSTGGRPKCDICKVCQGYFRLKRPCTPTSNAECECTEGFHCWGPNCAMCEKDCEPGQELTEQGCKSCGFGTFNDQSASGVCRPWTNCSLHGQSVLKNGTSETDVVCGPVLVSIFPGTSPTTVPTPERLSGERSMNVLTLFLSLTSAVLLFLLFIILGLSVARWIRKESLYIIKHPFKKAVQMAQEEDACSCRFPQEEEGGGGYEL